MRFGTDITPQTAIGQLDAGASVARRSLGAAIAAAAAVGDIGRCVDTEAAAVGQPLGSAVQGGRGDRREADAAATWGPGHAGDATRSAVGWMGGHGPA